MRCFLVHVYHRRHDILPAYPLDKEVSRPLEKRLYLFWGLALEKLRASGYEGIDKPGAVLSCPAPGLFNAALDKVIVPALRLDTALFDNLGKGASGAAVQNMNLMLGFEETQGLNL